MAASLQNTACIFLMLEYDLSFFLRTYYMIWVFIMLIGNLVAFIVVRESSVALPVWLLLTDTDNICASMGYIGAMQWQNERI